MLKLLTTELSYHKATLLAYGLVILPWLYLLYEAQIIFNIALIFYDLNHLFQHAETGALTEYSKIEETFAPEALKIIGDWIKSRTATN